MGETRPCPYCAETIQAAARVCRFCRSQLDQPVAPPNILKAFNQDRASRKVEAIASGKVASSPPGPGRITSSTWKAVILTFAVAIPGVLAYALGTDKEVGCMAMSLIFAGFVFLFVVASLVQDLMTPPPNARTTPEAAVRAFYGSLKRHHYGRAYACLSPLDRNPDFRITQAIPLMSVEPKSFGFEKPKPFGKYWRSQAGLDDRGIAGYHKSLSYEVLGVEEIRDGVAKVRVRLKVGGYPSFVVLTVLLGILIAVILMLVLRKEETYEITKVVCRRDGLWWIANGEFGDGEDAALADFLQRAK